MKPLFLSLIMFFALLSEAIIKLLKNNVCNVIEDGNKTVNRSKESYKSLSFKFTEDVSIKLAILINGTPDSSSSREFDSK